MIGNKMDTFAGGTDPSDVGDGPAVLVVVKVMNDPVWYRSAKADNTLRGSKVPLYILVVIAAIGTVLHPYLLTRWRRGQHCRDGSDSNWRKPINK